MKKLLLIFLLLTFGIQHTINNFSAQALEIDVPHHYSNSNTVTDAISKLEESNPPIIAKKENTPPSQKLVPSNDEKATKPATSKSKKIKAKVPIEVLVDELPVKNFQYNRYRPALIHQSYEGNIREIDLHRRTLAKALRNADKASDIEQIFEDAEFLFRQALTEHLLPKWYGTLWDFYGHCEKPQEGFIACGYLVSTNLKHVGVNINRYTLAQQWPINMVQSLVKEKYIQHVFSRSRSVETLEEMGFGLYIVGLDKHVGFIRYDEKGMLFIHSNYTGNQSVIAEPLRSSLAYTQTQNYYLTKLSNNREFLTKWLKGKRFRVKKQ